MDTALWVAVLGVLAAIIGVVAAWLSRVKRHEIRVHSQSASDNLVAIAAMQADGIKPSEVAASTVAPIPKESDAPSVGTSTQPDLANPPAPEVARLLRRIPRLSVQKGELSFLKEAGRRCGAQVEELNLSGCEEEVRDADLSCLREFPNVTDLNLSGCREITDAGLRHLRALKKLERLRLNDCDWLDGSGLHYLANLTELVELRISGKRLKDSGVAGLAECKNLRKLDFGMNVDAPSPPVVKQLKRALPNCTIKAMSAALDWDDEIGAIERALE